jgi:cyanophycinase
MSGTMSPNGTIALQGGGPFDANDDLDRRLLAAAGAQQVLVLPTADAFERPERLVAAAMNWGERLGVEVEALMVMRRGEAMEQSAANVVRRAKAVYFVGDQPIHLRSVLKDTPLWDALRDVLTNGGLVAASGGSAAAMCDPMVDPRGGAFTLGLGLVPNLALVTEAEGWSPERLHRTRKLANTAFAVLRTGDALVHTTTGWETVGGTEVHGELP